MMSRNRFQTYQNGLFEFLDLISPYFILNIGWFILSIPLITLIPATGGLYYATHILVRDGDATLGDLWHGFRAYFWISWIWAAVNIVAYGLMISNLLYYGRFDAFWAIWVRMAVLIVMLLWTCLQLYTFPFLILQDDKRIKVALRNSYVALIFQPFQSLGWGIIVIGLIFLSTLYAPPSWIVITATLCLSISNRTARKALTTLRPELFNDESENDEEIMATYEETDRSDL